MNLLFMPHVGDRVMFRKNYDEHPLDLTTKGVKGTVREVTDKSIKVHMDMHYPELDEWNNEIHFWCDPDSDDTATLGMVGQFSDYVVPITTSNPERLSDWICNLMHGAHASGDHLIDWFPNALQHFECEYVEALWQTGDEALHYDQMAELTFVIIDSTGMPQAWAGGDSVVITEIDKGGTQPTIVTIQRQQGGQCVMPLTSFAQQVRPRPDAIVCPHCGNKDLSKMRYIESIENWRQVNGLDEDGRLEIEGLYKTGEGYDDGHSPHLECHAEDDKGSECCGTLPLPDNIKTEFV